MKLGELIKIMGKKPDEPKQTKDDVIKNPQITKEEIDQRIGELEQKATELENQLKRAVADYQNLERRVNESRSELSSFVSAELVGKLLQVLDHLELALVGAKGSENQATAMSERSESNGWYK